MICAMPRAVWGFMLEVLVDDLSIVEVGVRVEKVSIACSFDEKLNDKRPFCPKSHSIFIHGRPRV